MQIETEQHVSIRAKREKNTCVYPCKLEYVTEVYFLFQICNSYCEVLVRGNKYVQAGGHGELFLCVFPLPILLYGISHYKHELLQPRRSKASGDAVVASPHEQGMSVSE